jgi:hypothetical protein
MRLGYIDCILISHKHGPAFRRAARQGISNFPGNTIGRHCAFVRDHGICCFAAVRAQRTMSAAPIAPA